MRALAISKGDWTTFVNRPISLTLLLIAIGFVALQAGVGNYLWKTARQMLSQQGNAGP